MRASSRGLAVVVACLALQACLTVGSGGSTDSGVGTSGSGGIGGVGGPGGTGGFPFDSGFFPGGTGGFTSDGGRPDGFVPGCGFCPPFDSAMAGLPIQGLFQPCCTDQGECGHVTPVISGECLPRDVPGFTDPGCPSESGIGFPFEGCCSLSGWCGIQLDALGLGCVRRSLVAQSPFLPIDPASDMRCLGAADNDAGAEVNALVCERAFATGRCDPLASCSADERGIQCTCPSGYADLSPEGLRGQVCRDINECLGAPVCPEGRCVNTPGSYRCDPIAP